jgi:hypothetical protein
MAKSPAIHGLGRGREVLTEEESRKNILRDPSIKKCDKIAFKSTAIRGSLEQGEEFHPSIHGLGRSK